jgi:OmpA-OmpF porin, OOP family
MRASLAILLMALALPATALPGARICNAGLPGDHRAGLDDDGDGIPDSEDWCAQTPAGAHAGSDGCAPGEVPVGCSTRPLQPVPKPKPVAEAAPVAEPAGATAPVGAASAATVAPQDNAREIEKLVLSGTAFALGSSKLLPEATPALKSVAAAMKANPKLEVEVGGHTDSLGPQQKNQRLSERRANAVKAFLVGEGIEAARLTAVGYGETQPVDSNDTPEGRAANRRVAFRITKE